MYEPAKPLPRWFTALPVGAFLALIAMSLTHRNFKPSHDYLVASAIPVLVATVGLANHLRRRLVGCVYRPRFGGGDDTAVYGQGRAWQQALLVSLVCVLALAFFIDSFCNTVFGDTRFSPYVVTGKYVEHQRFTSCNALRIARLHGPAARRHVCVAASTFDSIGPGQTLMIGEQTSWFGDEITSEQQATP